MILLMLYLNKAEGGGQTLPYRQKHLKFYYRLMPFVRSEYVLLKM